jgi:uncharacterized protein (DUF1330 family)
MSTYEDSKMSAFFVATVTVKNPEKMGEYGQKVGATLQPFGGELIVRGAVSRALAGKADHKAAAVIKFPTLDALNQWYASADYQALIPVREAAADMTIIAYETVV